MRLIDNLLVGEQNGTAGSSYTHRPTGVDGHSAQVRATSERFPSLMMEGWPSDFEKAYKQVPNDVTQKGMTVLAQWSPTHEKVVFWVTLSQAFGGRTPPTSFARYPAWFCWALVVLYAIPASHCVDDMIAIERGCFVVVGWRAWRAFVKLAGWDISDAKSPFPSNSFTVIGVKLNLSALPTGAAVVMIAEKRIEALELLITSILTANRLGSGQVASLFGKLGFSLTATFGRFGRAKLRPISRRAYEGHTMLNYQLQECLVWWMRFLKTYTPRPVPFRLRMKHLTRSYSDGEGSLAGVGVAVWSTRISSPVAGYMKVPPDIRDLWQRRAGNGVYRDIFLVEAIGPLMILEEFTHLVEDAMWVHYIDNSGAQYALVNGPSSIMSADVIIGETWMRIEKVGAWAFFDRVESEANPIDGVSRGKYNGPWKPQDLKRHMEFPSAVLKSLQNIEYESILSSTFRTTSMSFAFAPKSTFSSSTSRE